MASSVFDSLTNPEQEPEVLPKAPRVLRPKDVLTKAHRLLSSYLSDVGSHTNASSVVESDGTNSDQSEDESEGEIRTIPESESELLSGLVEKLQKALERVSEAKGEKRSQISKELEHQILRVGWPGYVYFRSLAYQDGAMTILVLHGHPKHYSEYAKELLGKPNSHSQTISIDNDAAPVVLSDTPTQRPYLVSVGYPFRESLRDVIGELASQMPWPFKKLYYYDKNIRNAFHLLKTHRSEDGDSVTWDNPPLADGSPKTSATNGYDKVNQDTDPIEQKLEPSEREMLDTTPETISKIKDFEALISFMDSDLAPIWNRFSTAGEKCQTVKFEELWYVFRPGDICFAPVTSTLRATMRLKANSVGRDAIAQTLTNSQRYQETWRVLHTTGGRPRLHPSEEGSDGLDLKINPFVIRCYYIDFDGTGFFPVVHDFEIGPFEGEVFVPSLSICPSRFVVGGKDIEVEFRKTGEIFRDLAKFKSFYYSETTFVGNPCGCPNGPGPPPPPPTNWPGARPRSRHRSPPRPRPRPPPRSSNEQMPEFVESPVIVDFSEGLRSRRDWLIENQSRILEPLRPDTRETSRCESYIFNLKKSSQKVLVSAGKALGGADDDYELDEMMMEEFISGNNFLNRFRDDINSTFEDLDENDLVLLPPRVFGFVLRSRKFGKISPFNHAHQTLTSVLALLKARHLESIQRDEAGFDRLKLPEGHKRMVQSLVIHHMNEMNARSAEGGNHEYDIVRGKGKGLIVLLHGAPGVGKTSTAGKHVCPTYSR
jgi:hypothetical protein